MLFSKNLEVTKISCFDSKQKLKGFGFKQVPPLIASFPVAGERRQALLPRWQLEFSELEKWISGGFPKNPKKTRCARSAVVSCSTSIMPLHLGFIIEKKHQNHRRIRPSESDFFFWSTRGIAGRVCEFLPMSTVCPLWGGLLWGGRSHLCLSKTYVSFFSAVFGASVGQVKEQDVGNLRNPRRLGRIMRWIW